ncbi:MAG: tRNA 5-methoxyuridine(34)/uridine 5-oxyacetic acid(34) synthase CmoB [Candidatus Margulisbacteria bacterium]|nr:tRNA 5-methoxyuridine(34)/uridine 5-oxyacetic acid(34) synthase CmoB [Candidatus Margulisiibacteriota bacterium]
MLPIASRVILNQDVVEIGDPDDLTPDIILEIKTYLESLKPWRKGPFKIFGIDIEGEWQSHMKWNRILPHISSLTHKHVLDIGSNSGYYLFRMMAEQPESVVGMDPAERYYRQFAILNRFASIENIKYIPQRVEAFKENPTPFDTVFCMGILYHNRDPKALLSHIYALMVKGGELVIDTLIYPGKNRFIFEPESRYAGMNNVHHLPTLSVLLDWMKESGFSRNQVVDTNQTTIEEQRQTNWSPGYSLKNFLLGEDKNKTTEGYPAPLRAVVIGKKCN